MEILIAVVIAVVAIGIISVFFLLRTGKRTLYSRPSEDTIETDDGPAARPREPRRARPAGYPSGEGNMTSYLAGGLRILAGIAAVALLAYIYTSAQDAARGITDNTEITRIYTGAIFKAVITIGCAAGLYILSRFSK